MIIKGFHIDGFGLFHDTGIESLSSGLSVILGANEAGKSTLLSFLSNALFGFSTQSKADHYAPLRGGKHAGRLILEAQGQTYTLERRAGARGGPVSLMDAESAALPEDRLHHLLDGATESLYRHVYAFGLDELRDLDTLEEADLRAVLYGAGAGTAAQALSTARKRLDSMKDDIYLPRGQKAQLNKIFKELEAVRKKLNNEQQHLDLYNEKQIRLLEVHNILVVSQERVATLSAEESSSSKLLAAWEHWVAYGALREELKTLPESLDSLPLDAEVRLDHLLLEQRNLQEQHAGLQVDIAQGQAEADGLEVDVSLLEQETSLQWLMDQRQSFQEALETIPLLQQRIRQTTEEIQHGLRRLGQGWTESSIRECDRSVLSQQRMDACSKALRDSDAVLDRSKDKAEDAEDAWKAAQEEVERFQREIAQLEEDESFDVPTLRRQRRQFRSLLIAGSLLCVLIFAAGIWNVVSGDLFNGSIWIVAAMIAATMPIRMALMLYEFQKEPLPYSTEEKTRLSEHLRFAEDRTAIAHKTLEQRQTDVVEREAELATCQLAWQEYLASLGLSGDLDPETAREALELVDRCTGLLSDCAADEKTLGRKQATCDQYSATAEAFFGAIAVPCPANARLSSVVAGEWDRCRAHREALVQREGLEKQLDKTASNLKALTKKADTAQKELSALLATGNTSDPETFRRATQDAARRWQLQESIRDKERNLCILSGVAEFSVLSERLAQTTYPTLKAQHESVRLALQQEKEQYSEALQESARLKTELKHLRDEESIASLRAEEETLLAACGNHAQEWRRYALAKALLDRSCAKFEQEQQPEVIRDAEVFFKRFTGARYTRIYAPLDEAGISVLNARNERKEPNALSRGTAEQLYLALRFGYIRHRGRQQEPLPVLMDDILVNFDPQRAAHTVEAIAELARDQQILFFTCHPETVQRFKECDTAIPIYTLEDGSFSGE